MPWRGAFARICRRCGRDVSECGPLSARYLCQECGEGASIQNRRGLMEHAGPYFHNWRRGMAAAVGAILPEEPDTSEPPLDLTG